MAKWDYTGVHGLNKYLWSRIKTELGWKESDYGGLVPITTPQQQPEFNSYNKPYIVYSYTLQGTGPEWWMKREIGIYTVFSATPADVRQVINLIDGALGRYEESANAVNDYIQANGSTDNKQFDYKIITTSQANGPEPSTSEGGRHDGRIVVSMEYTHYNASAGLEQSDSIRL